MSNKNKAPKSSCNKVKNPCKFCLQQVTNNNGLQCQGACKKWAHFKCLNYTPGKISDIKAGIIKVTCPCPDCETTQVKEFLTNPPYTCSNNGCPAKKPPKCDSFECPSNNKRRRQQPNTSVPIVDYSSCPNKECPNKESPNKECPNKVCPNKECPNEVVECPAAECPNLQQDKKSHPRLSPPRLPTPPRCTPKTKSPPGSPACRTTPNDKPCVSDSKKQSPKICRNDNKTGGKTKPVRKSPSCSMLSSDNSRCPGTKSSSSDSDVCGPKNQASLMQALQEMCGTVGKLSLQLKELMCRMMQNV